MRRLAMAAIAWAVAANPGLAHPRPVLGEPFLVFFDWGKTDITRDSAATLDTVASAWRQSGDVQIILSGHSDRSGPPAVNRRSSERRANAVRNYLAGHGVPGAAIVITAFGEARPIVPTEDNVREAQNRRVEIHFISDSGN